MSRPDQRLSRLAEIGTVLKDTALARLRAAAQDCQRLEDALADLDAEARHAAADEDIVARALFEAARIRRHAERRKALNAELARARAQQAEFMREAARAFGKDQALQRLLERSRRS